MTDDNSRDWPFTVWMNVMLYAELNDVVRCRRVCSLFYRNADWYALWEHLIIARVKNFSPLDISSDELKDKMRRFMKRTMRATKESDDDDYGREENNASYCCVDDNPFFCEGRAAFGFAGLAAHAPRTLLSALADEDDLTRLRDVFGYARSSCYGFFSAQPPACNADATRAVQWLCQMGAFSFENPTNAKTKPARRQNVDVHVSGNSQLLDFANYAHAGFVADDRAVFVREFGPNFRHIAGMPTVTFLTALDTLFVFLQVQAPRWHRFHRNVIITHLCSSAEFLFDDRWETFDKKFYAVQADIDEKRDQIFDADIADDHVVGVWVVFKTVVGKKQFRVYYFCVASILWFQQPWFGLLKLALKWYPVAWPDSLLFFTPAADWAKQPFAASFLKSLVTSLFADQTQQQRGISFLTFDDDDSMLTSSSSMSMTLTATIMTIISVCVVACEWFLRHRIRKHEPRFGRQFYPVRATRIVLMRLLSVIMQTFFFVMAAEAVVSMWGNFSIKAWIGEDGDASSSVSAVATASSAGSTISSQKEQAASTTGNTTLSNSHSSGGVVSLLLSFVLDPLQWHSRLALLVLFLVISWFMYLNVFRKLYLGNKQITDHLAALCERKNGNAKCDCGECDMRKYVTAYRTLWHRQKNNDEKKEVSSTDGDAAAKARAEQERVAHILPFAIRDVNNKWRCEVLMPRVVMAQLVLCTFGVAELLVRGGSLVEIFLWMFVLEWMCQQVAV